MGKPIDLNTSLWRIVWGKKMQSIHYVYLFLKKKEYGFFNDVQDNGL